MRNPPVPQGLVDILHRYPALINELERSLADVVDSPVGHTPSFEVAAWLLESKLATFIRNARAMLERAHAEKDDDFIFAAEQQLTVMHHAHSRNGGLRDLSQLWDHFNRSPR